jgi:hypothetical protein
MKKAAGSQCTLAVGSPPATIAELKNFQRRERYEEITFYRYHQLDRSFVFSGVASADNHDAEEEHVRTKR